jgi:hypothetical protein
MRIFQFLAMILWLLLSFSYAGETEQGPVFIVSFDASLGQTEIDGRMLLCLSTDDRNEPRFQIKGGPDTQQIFGVDVENLKPGEEVRFDTAVFGYPKKSLRALPDGTYRIQAVLNRYETFHRSDGHVVKLPMDYWEGQLWNRKPGNFYNEPLSVEFNPAENKIVRIVLDKKIPVIPEPEDTEYIKHVRIKSDLLSEFWGRPIYLGAHVLLPWGYESHPESRYPLVIFHGHFGHDFWNFRMEPPDPDLKPVFSERFGVEGYNRIMQEYAYQFYKDWISPDYPRYIIIEIQHANPYYDDSYAVNSENLGPYGDAITYELIPYIENKFRGIGKGWARFLYGGSTGGWEALAAQIFYPDEYNGCWASCPDPIDFRAYTIVNIYEHKNAYYLDSALKSTPRPGSRNYLGEVQATLEEMNHRERVLGTHSRSGQQWDIWQAVYSPVGKDGYPKPIWNKMTGEIDHRVAEYWKEHYDLRYILERDWKKLGPKLAGKIHIYCGDMDNYYLNNAVYLMEGFLEATLDPYYDGEIDYGDRAEHCWNGDHSRPNHLSRLRYHQMHAPKILKRIEKSAPKGADLSSWRY